MADGVWMADDGGKGYPTVCYQTHWCRGSVKAAVRGMRPHVNAVLRYVRCTATQERWQRVSTGDWNLLEANPKLLDSLLPVCSRLTKCHLRSDGNYPTILPARPQVTNLLVKQAHTVQGRPERSTCSTSHKNSFGSGAEA